MKSCNINDLYSKNSEDLGLKKYKSTKINKKKEFINSQIKRKQPRPNEEIMTKEKEKTDKKINRIKEEESNERKKTQCFNKKFINDFKKNHKIPDNIPIDIIKTAFIANNFDEEKTASVILSK